MAYSLSLSCDSTSKTLCHTPVLALKENIMSFEINPNAEMKAEVFYLSY